MFKKSVSALLLSLSMNQAYADDWNVFIEPYLHGISIEGKAAVGRVDADDVDVNLDRILETLHMGGMINLKAIHSSGWGGAIDYAFMDLRDKIKTPRGGVLGAKVKQTGIQAELIYFQQRDEATLEYLLGLRWWDNEIDLDLNTAGDIISPSLSRDYDWVDFFVGLRWVEPINEDWEYMIRGDIGAGDADFTSSLVVGVQYTLSENSTLSIKYKSTWVDYDEGTPNDPSYFKYDTATHGPAIGYIYQF